MKSRLLAALAAVACVACVGAVLAPSPTSSAAGVAACTPPSGVTTYTWTGGSGNWADTSHWVGGVRPGLAPGSEATDYVCLDAAGGTVVLDSLVNSVRIQAIEVAAGTTLRLVDNGKLRLYGDHATRPSVVRGTFELLHASSLGGPGLLRLEGQMLWRGVSTVSSSACFARNPTAEPTCVEPGGDGVLAIAPGATAELRGGLGVNVLDGYGLQIGGTLRIAQKGAYIAADRDTPLEVLPGGEIEVTADGGILEGFGNGLPRLTNAGTIRKSGGNGVTPLEVAYTQVGAGRIVVEDGGLSLPGGRVEVRVAAGSTFRTGRCAARQVACAIPVTQQDREFGSITPSTASLVRVVELARPARSLGRAVRLDFPGRRTARAALGYLTQRSPASIRVWRAPPGGGKATPVKDCIGRADRFPGNAASCISGRVRHTGGARPGVLRAADQAVKILLKVRKPGRFIAR